ncbi:peptidylprolyl isomerase PrsA [Ligilactobacillus ceti]|uniref:Foldase protein PrsA n=1 Tax=Ligilactobacillus ceti DSM 22408 TaxID=1122146 RepID=A0A0R2KGM5_9LACO|nr:peptidylprolyl isomerase PrsA [Ligilactobacillus ceti]KRN88510.1 peptidyl-prolyl cis-trans isomerase [Ligilactobacillus ceti DSM 22408]
MNKKVLVACASVLLTMSLAACSKTVATTSGGKITETEFYDSMKNTSAGKQVLQQMILNKCLEKEYGDKVSDKKVDKDFDNYKKQYGDAFESVLKQNNLTKSAFKQQIRSNLLLRQAVIANTKITNKMLENQWKKYEPKITVAHILVKNEDEAKNIIAALDKDHSFKNFKKLAKEKSIDASTKGKGGELPPFDNTDTQLDPTFKAAAFKLKQGEFSKEPVKTNYGYHIIYSVKNAGKGTMKEHKQELKDQIIDAKMTDPATLQEIIAKVLKKGDVSIKDSDLKDVLANYLPANKEK